MLSSMNQMAEKDTDISFVIPFYRGEDYIGRLLKSLVKAYSRSTVLKVELILVIDSIETDVEVLTTLTNFETHGVFHTTIIKNENNLGVAGSRNAGIRIANGKYIVCIDQDDEVTPVWFSEVEKVVKIDADFILCNGKFYFARFGYSVPIYFIPPQITIKNLARFDIIRSPGQVLVKRSLISKTGYPVPQMAFGADDKFCWILLFLTFEIKTAYIHRQIYIGHFHHNNYSNDFRELYRSGLELWGQINARFPDEFEKVRGLAPKNIRFYNCRLRRRQDLFDTLLSWKEVVYYYSYPNRILGYILKKIKTLSTFL